MVIMFNNANNKLNDDNDSNNHHHNIDSINNNNDITDIYIERERDICIYIHTHTSYNTTWLPRRSPSAGFTIISTTYVSEIPKNR